VTVSAASSKLSEANINDNSLAFTPTNWNGAQTVIVTGVNDNVSDGDQQFAVLLGCRYKQGATDCVRTRSAG
jgi:hypothetical protein